MTSPGKIFHRRGNSIFSYVLQTVAEKLITSLHLLFNTSHAYVTDEETVNIQHKQLAVQTFLSGQKAMKHVNYTKSHLEMILPNAIGTSCRRADHVECFQIPKFHGPGERKHPYVIFILP